MSGWRLALIAPSTPGASSEEIPVESARAVESTGGGRTTGDTKGSVLGADGARRGWDPCGGGGGEGRSCGEEGEVGQWGNA